MRRIAARAFPGAVGARVQDGVHDMAVVVRHDGAQVTAVRARTLEIPWSTCPEAKDRLQSLVGAKVGADSRAAAAGIDQHFQCTHLLDLARFAIGHIARGGTRRYRIAVAPAADRAIEASAVRDGREILRWEIVDGVVTQPAAFAGHRVGARADFGDAFEADADLFETAMMLRRAILVYRGRRRLDPNTRSAETMTWMTGACYTFQPVNAARARRADGG